MARKNRRYFMYGAAFVLANLIAAVVFAGGTGNEDSKIIWSCKKNVYSSENILWLVEWGSKSYVKVFDERITAKYSMDGLEKRWDWGSDTSDFSSKYAITLAPDQIARYYDFSLSKDGTASSREVYKCTKAISKTEAERRRKAAEKKQKEKETQARLAAEQEPMASQRRTAMQRMVDEYVLYIQEKVQRSWIRPPDLGSGLTCTVEVRLIPSGDVVDARIVRSSGNPVFDQSVEAAVFKASPLPVPPDVEVMEKFRTIRFEFNPG